MNVNTSSNTCMLIHTRQPKSWFNLGGGGGSEGNIALLSVLSASGVLVEHDGLHKMLLHVYTFVLCTVFKP